jgi:hypothetical protein
LQLRKDFQSILLIRISSIPDSLAAKTDLLVSIKAIVINDYNGISNYTQGWLRASKISSPVRSIGAARDIDISDAHLGVIRVEHIVLVTLTPHPAGNHRGGISISCRDILSSRAVAISSSRYPDGERRSIAARMAEEPVAGHVLAMTTCGIPELTLSA